MKRLYLIIASIFLIGILVACGANDNNDSVNAPNETNQNQGVDNTVTDNENNDVVNSEEATDNNNIETTEEMSVNEKMEELNFSEIEVEIDYGDDQEYEAEVEKRKNGDYEAEIEDELTNTYLKGEEAFNKLYPILQDLDINPESSKEEVIAAVLKSFDLEDNYQEFEVEITFNDGTKLEYEEKN